MLATTVNWIAWEPQTEAWLLVAAVIGFATYTAKVIQPKAVAAGEQPITKSQERWFITGLILLWLASDWPIHTIGEKYLYSVHMVQHMIITFVVPPVFLLATPAWLLRLMVGKGRFEHFFRKASKPLISAVVYNLLVILSHWSTAVEFSVLNGPIHFTLHLALFFSAILAWMPVVSPAPEYRTTPPAAMVHLFLLSVIPTIPGGWLANAEGVVYPVYDRPDRLWGISVRDDQQMAGVIMKVVGGLYLWSIIAVIFFKWMNADRKGKSSKYRGTLVSVTDEELDSLVAASSETGGPAEAP